MTTDQVFEVAVTAAQRWVLLQLSHANGQKLQGQQGRVFRRFVRAFGLNHIIDVVNAHGGRLNPEQLRSPALAIFTLTAENIDYALGLSEVERKPVDEMTVGPLFDILEDLKAGRPYGLPDGAGLFDDAAECWAPTKEKTTDERIAAFLRDAGQTRAAELVEHGGWDRASPNGEAAKSAQSQGGRIA